MATFDYTSRDFVSIRQDLLTRASVMIPELTTTDASDFSNTLIDLWSYMGDILHFYVDRAASEAFLETATQRDSVMAIANLLDYIPSGVRSARGTVNTYLTAFPAMTSSYVLPQYTVMQGIDAEGNTYPFYTTAASSAFTTVGQQIVVPVVQGTYISDELLGTSNGGPNQKISLIKKEVDIDSIVINVMEGPLDGSNNPTSVQYQYVPQLSTATYLDKVFTAHSQSDGSMQIHFGNGFNGAIPSSNAPIYASYRTTAGSAGNLGTGRITRIDGAPSSYVAIASSTATTGGADVESIESIKTNVARLYRTQDRAVSLQDYKDLALQTPGVSKSTAIFANGVVYSTSVTAGINSGLGTVVVSTGPSSLPLKAGQLVTLSGFSPSTFNITNAQVIEIPTSTSFSIRLSEYATPPTGTASGGTVTAHDTVVLYPVPHQSEFPPLLSGSTYLVDIPTPTVEYIESYFATRTMVGVNAAVTSLPELTTSAGTTYNYIVCSPVYARLKVHVLDNYVQSWVQTELDKKIRELLAFENVYFDQRLTVGEVYRAALNVTGVDYVEILNLNGTYSGADTVATVADVVAPSTQLLCFVDGANPAVSFKMVGGLTGSN